MVPALNAFLAEVVRLQTAAKTRPARKVVVEALGRFLEQAHVEAVVGARASSYFEKAEALRQLFREFDVDGNKQLSVEEAEVLLASGKVRPKPPLETPLLVERNL